jgi:hypothetical protein
MYEYQKMIERLAKQLEGVNLRQAGPAVEYTKALALADLAQNVRLLADNVALIGKVKNPQEDKP